MGASASKTETLDKFISAIIYHTKIGKAAEIFPHELQGAVYSVKSMLLMVAGGLVVQGIRVSAAMELTLKHRDMHGCVASTVVTDALVLKHQAISIHNAD